MDADGGVLEPHHSGVRRLAAIVTGEEYIAYRSLEDARADPDAAVIFEGDDGGQVYLTCPVRNVRCGEEVLRSLLADLDRLAWGQPDRARMQFERRPVGSGVGGGMGGGIVREGPWLHAELDTPGLAAQVVAVLAGERPTLDLRESRRVVWSTEDLATAAPPRDLGLPALSSDLLDDVLAVLAEGAPVEGKLAVFGFGSFVLELVHPSGGKATLLVWPSLARFAFDGLARDATIDFRPSVFEYNRLIALLRGVLDTGLAVRVVGDRLGVDGSVDGADLTSIVMTIDEDGAADATFWSPDTLSVDWLSAELGPVERVPPVRG